MGQYKVIQDIEAEDKLLGPLTLRQFIYAIIVIVSLFAGFKLFTAGGIGRYLTIFLIPHTVFFATLAAPFGHDQSNEVWLLAKIRFFFKPRRRIWDQSGIKELVTITVPKHIEKQLTKDFTQNEVRSRLSALANTIDSRGWAVKNVNANLFQQPAYGMIPDSDRLITVSDIPREVPIEEVGSSYDILDEFDNPTAVHMGQLINDSESAHHQQLVSMMQPGSAATTASTPVQDQQWFTAPQQSVDSSQTTPTQQTPPQTSTINDQMPPQQPATTQINSINQQPLPTVTPVTDPAIINLAINDDLNVATIARQADKAVEQNKDEVVISLR